MEPLNNVIEMEKFVLSAMQIREGECVPTVMASLESDDFYRPTHRLVFRASLKLYTEGTPPNVLSLIKELTKTGEIENVSLEFLYMLTEYANTTAYVPAYCKEIKEASNMRRAQITAEKAAQEFKAGTKTVREIIAAFNTELSAITGAGNATKISTFGSYFNHQIIPALKESSKYGERKTGFDNLDEKQIFSPGLYVLGAVPACGKTTFAWQLLEQLARNGEPCIFCSYEMSALELYTKSVARELLNRHPNEDPLNLFSAAKIRRYEAQDLPRDVIDVMNDFAGNTLPLKVIELRNETVDELLNLLRPLCTGGDKAPVVCVDYLQIIPSDKDITKNGIDDTVRKIKQFQGDTGTTFIVISSFNRLNYTQTVSYESFKESGNIEYTADVVWGLQLNIMNKIAGKDASSIRKVVDEAKKQIPREVQLKCLKNRQGTNYECYFKYFSGNDCFVPCAAFDDKKKSASTGNTSSNGFAER